MRPLLEICVESLADARAARAGGADRLELCARLDLDGLTPDSELLRSIKAATQLSVMAMIRHRPGGFVYSGADVGAMSRSIESLAEVGADGFVFGALTLEGLIDETACGELLRRCGPRPAVFHRAFDLALDRVAALEQVIALGFRRVLTAGGGGPATGPAAIAEIRRMITQARDRIEILPGGGIRAENIALLMRGVACTQIHSAAREPGADATNVESVAALRAMLDSLSATTQSP